MKKLLLIALIFVSGGAMAQNVGIGTANPDESAILDLKSSNKGFLLPRLTEKQKTLIPQPAEGLMIYQTDASQGVYLYQGGNWKNMGSANVTTSTISGATANIAPTYTANYLLTGDGTSSPVSSSVYVNPSNGYLGIGSSNPSYMLDVNGGGRFKGDFAFDASLRNANLVLDGGTTYESTIYFSKNTAPKWNLGLSNNDLTFFKFVDGAAESFRFTSNGRLGIGISNPSYSLDVNGGGRFKGDFAFDASLRNANLVLDAGTYASSIYFSKNTAPKWNLGLVDNDLTFFKFSNGTAESFRFTSNGRLGIGVSNPSYMLDVNGGGRFKGDFAFDASLRNANLVLDAGTFASSIYFSKNTAPKWNLGLIGDDLTFFKFSNGAAETFRFTSNGRLGIGTTSPNYQLDVNGTGYFANGLISNSFVKNGGTSNQYLMADGSVSTLSNIVSGSGVINFIPKFNNTGVITSSSISESAITNANEVKLNSKSAGYLAVGDFGLGTPMSIPTGYRLVVQDGIITEKVKVAVRNQNDWADYVFEPNYRLMPLNEVEQFVKENKHLPNVPSADEMVQQGVEVGKTSKMFMEKIEELTLYLIELKKEVEMLKAENAKLKK